MGYFAKIEEKRRLKKLYDETKTRYGSGAWYSERKNRYIRYSLSDGNRSGNLKRYFSRVGNRRIRRLNDELPKKSLYKRYFDLWWTLT